MDPQAMEAVLVRRFPHPISRVYGVWTDPKHLAEWLRPFDDVTLEIPRFDFHEGGEYQFRYTWPDGVFPVRGRFLTIRPEECLIFSWEPQPPDVDAGKETMVSVWFRTVEPGQTELEVRHTLFPDATMRQRHDEGWTATLDRLARYLLITNTSASS